jgi:hypothetical protein
MGIGRTPMRNANLRTACPIRRNPKIRTGPVADRDFLPSLVHHFISNLERNQLI